MLRERPGGQEAGSRSRTAAVLVRPTVSHVEWSVVELSRCCPMFGRTTGKGLGQTAWSSRMAALPVLPKGNCSRFESTGQG